MTNARRMGKMNRAELEAHIERDAELARADRNYMTRCCAKTRVRQLRAELARREAGKTGS